MSRASNIMFNQIKRLREERNSRVAQRRQQEEEEKQKSSERTPSETQIEFENLTRNWKGSKTVIIENGVKILRYKNFIYKEILALNINGSTFACNQKIREKVSTSEKHNYRDFYNYFNSINLERNKILVMHNFPLNAKIIQYLYDNLGRRLIGKGNSFDLVKSTLRHFDVACKTVSDICNDDNRIGDLNQLISGDIIRFTGCVFQNFSEEDQNAQLPRKIEIHAGNPENTTKTHYAVILDVSKMVVFEQSVDNCPLVSLGCYQLKKICGEMEFFRVRENEVF